MCLQINTVKYNANWEIMNIYENLQIVWSQFCTNKQLFVYIWSTSNINWFISIQICCQWIQTNSYLVTFSYTQYLVQHSMSVPEGKKTTIRRYLGPTTVLCRATVCFGVSFECLRRGSTVVEHSNSDLKDEGLNPGTDIRKIIYKVLRFGCLMFFLS